MSCDMCVYNEYDEESECYSCSINLDEDELMRLMTDSHYRCPYFRLDDEYGVVKKQN